MRHMCPGKEVQAIILSTCPGHYFFSCAAFAYVAFSNCGRDG